MPGSLSSERSQDPSHADTTHGNVQTKSMIESVNPITGSVVVRVPVDLAEQVDAQVSRARDAAVEWAALSPRERGSHLGHIRRCFADRASEIAAAITAETGKPLPDAYLEVLAACGMWSWASKKAPKLLTSKRIKTGPLVLKQAHVQYEPLGVVGVISPWNYPVAIPMQSLPYALVAGNTIVFKPSEYTLRTGQLIAEAINAAGRELVYVVAGDGRTGDALVRAAVDKVVFTGSGGVGRKILAATAEHLTPVIMELGGKDAAIVCADANLDRAARTVVGAAFTNAGQLCMATERAFVDATVYDAFVDRVSVVARGLRVGSGPDAHLGPLTRPEQADVLLRRLADAEHRGARVVLGGNVSQIGPAVYFEPTVVVDVTPEMALLREESFGPILSIIKVSGTQEALDMTNASEFGLNSSVFTTSKQRARDIASAIRAGGVHVNDALVGNAIGGVPFGGVKSSGYGRLQGDVGLFEFVASKTIISDRWSRSPGLTALMVAPRRPSPALLRGVIAAAYSSRRPFARKHT